MCADFPLEIDQRAKDHADEGGYDNTWHIAGQVYLIHGDETSDIADDSQRIWYETFFAVSQFMNTPTVYFLEQNEALADNPELVNQDPYGKGWLIKIKPNDSNDVNDLLDAEGYKALVNE